LTRRRRRRRRRMRIRTRMRMMMMVMVLMLMLMLILLIAVPTHLRRKDGGEVEPFPPGVLLVEPLVQLELLVEHKVPAVLPVQDARNGPRPGVDLHGDECVITPIV
jgi:hypothetical protein